jgi:hypothetical protein
MNQNKVQCQICKKWFKQITGTHLENKHHITFEKYKEMFPDVETHPQWLRDQLVDANIEKWSNQDYKDRTAKTISEKNKIVMNKPEMTEKLKGGSLRRWSCEYTDDYLQTMKEMGKRQMDKDNPNWRGGSSFEKYPKEFRERRLYIIEKYNNSDYFSGIHKNICSKNVGLSVHHIDYDKQNNIENNLIPLCKKNHLLIHKKYKYRFVWSKLIKYAQYYDKEYYKESDKNFNIIKELI